MKDQFSIQLFIAIAAAVASLTLSSCNTIRGAGRDVENVGAGVATAASR